MVMLDHLTRGRVMLGVGPGSLPTDSAMIGLNPIQTREILEPNLSIILRLLAGETVTEKTITHELIDARLQLRPYSDIEVAVAAVASPTGARMARHLRARTAEHRRDVDPGRLRRPGPSLERRQ